MTCRINHIAAAALSLVLVLTGQAMAQLRAAPGPAGVMQICTGTGPVMVVIGEDGNPLGTAHVCPDCVLSAMTGILPQGSLPVHQPRVARLSVAGLLVAAGAFRKPSATARSPPPAG